MAYNLPIGTINWRGFGDDAAEEEEKEEEEEFWPGPWCDAVEVSEADESGPLFVGPVLLPESVSFMGELLPGSLSPLLDWSTFAMSLRSWEMWLSC